MSFKAIWANNSPYSKFMISVGIILISAVFFTLVSTLVVSVFFGVEMSNMGYLLNDLEKKENINILKVVQTISAIGTFLIPPFILAWLFHPSPIQYLSLDKKPSRNGVIGIILLLLISVPLINYMGELNSYFHLPSALKSVEDWMRNAEEQAARLTEAFLIMQSPGDLFFNILMIALLPAIGEELVFRGVVQNIFTGWLKSPHTAVWLTAFLFSAMHMQFYGFIPRLMLGAMLGYLLVWSGNIWWPILAHFVNNAAAVIFSYMFQNGHIKFNADTVGLESGHQVIVLLSLVSTVILLYILHREGNKKRLESVV